MELRVQCRGSQILGASESPRGLLKTQIAGCSPRVSALKGVRGGTPEFAYLQNSQVMLMLLVWGP